MILLSVGYPDI